MSKKLKSNPAKSVLTITVGFLAVYLIFREKEWAEYALYVSLGIGALGVLSTFLATKIEWAWFQLAKLLGLIVPNILLSVVFYIFLFPISVIARVVSGKDALNLKNKETTFSQVDKHFKEADFKNPW